MGRVPPEQTHRSRGSVGAATQRAPVNPSPAPAGPIYRGKPPPELAGPHFAPVACTAEPRRGPVERHRCITLLQGGERVTAARWAPSVLALGQNRKHPAALSPGRWRGWVPTRGSTGEGDPGPGPSGKLRGGSRPPAPRVRSEGRAEAPGAPTGWVCTWGVQGPRTSLAQGRPRAGWPLGLSMPEIQEGLVCASGKEEANTDRF